MSGRDHREIALEALEILLPLGVAVVHAVRVAIEQTRPDIQIADPPPAGRYSEIVSEDEEVLGRRFGGGGSGS